MAPTHTPINKPYYIDIAAVMRKRIEHGDYALKPIPSERKLASEFGVNYMTVRRGLNLLFEEGLLSRRKSGRVVPAGTGRHTTRKSNIALLISAGDTRNSEKIRIELEKNISKRTTKLNLVLYRHWDDPTLTDSLEAFDGIFLCPCASPINPRIVEKLSRHPTPLVVIDQDFSRFNIPSIRLFPPICTHQLLEHLKKLGHNRIGCLNTQVHNSEIMDRINQWRFWMEANECEGQLVDINSAPFEDTSKVGFETMTALLHDKGDKETAWLCTTVRSAMGAMRAMLDHDIVPGKDIAICAINGEGIAEMLFPRLTAIEVADVSSYYKRCLKWMRTGGPWSGPLHMEPKKIVIEARSSTTG